MAENIIKNKRFREGVKVDIHFAPVFEGYTQNIVDASVGNTWKVTATMNKDMSIEQLGVSDLMAFSFGVGVIEVISGYDVTVGFPNSMFPDANVMRYVGNKVQHCYGFLAVANRMQDMLIHKYVETIQESVYGHMKASYGLKTIADLYLTPIRKVDDGSLANLLRSKGFVLKSCDDENYDTNAGSWLGDFPLELSGTSVDPIYRRAFLKKRSMETRSNKAKANLQFNLIG